MRSITLAIAGLAIATAISTAAGAQNPSLFQFMAQPGPHPVGLKVVEQYDFSRIYHPATDELGQPYKGERARPIQTLIWYPSTKVEGKPMTFGDYIGLLATETSFGHPRPEDLKEPQANMAPSLAAKLWAMRRARDAVANPEQRTRGAPAATSRRGT